MQIKIAFLSLVSSACLNVWRCVATFFSWLYVLLLCYHAFAIVVVVKNKKRMNEWISDRDPYAKTNPSHRPNANYKKKDYIAVIEQWAPTFCFLILLMSSTIVSLIRLSVYANYESKFRKIIF